jgi:hypothetical protein
VGCRDVPIHIRDVNLCTAEAPCAAFLGLRRKLAARFPHCLLPCRPGACIAVLSEIIVSEGGQQIAPSGLELSSRVRKVGGGTFGVYAKAAVPAPLVGGRWDTGAGGGFSSRLSSMDRRCSFPASMSDVR